MDEGEKNEERSSVKRVEEYVGRTVTAASFLLSNSWDTNPLDDVLSQVAGRPSLAFVQPHTAGCP